jgi:hypothetical protein
VSRGSVHWPAADCRRLPKGGDERLAQLQRARVFEISVVRQRDFAWLSVQLYYGPAREVFGHEVDVQHAKMVAHHPLRFVPFWQRAQALRSAVLSGRTVAFHAAATAQIAEQRVAWPVVCHELFVSVAPPDRCRHAVAQPDETLQLGVRAAQTVEHGVRNGGRESIKKI